MTGLSTNLKVEVTLTGDLVGFILGILDGFILGVLVTIGAGVGEPGQSPHVTGQESATLVIVHLVVVLCRPTHVQLVDFPSM